MPRSRAALAAVPLALALALGSSGAHPPMSRRYLGSIDAVGAVAQLLQNCAGTNDVPYTVGGACFMLPHLPPEGTFTAAIADASALRVPGYWVQKNANGGTIAGPTPFCRQASGVALHPSAARIVVYAASTSLALTPCATAAPGTAGIATAGIITLSTSR